MRIVSYNVNGIRAAIKKGLLDWLATENIDVLCLQETKATHADIDIAPFEKLGYHVYWFAAEKKGYSGVAVFTKIKPAAVVYGQNIAQSDMEGRVIQLQFKKFTLVNAYFPSGTSGDERQAYKYIWLNDVQQYLQSLQLQQPNIVLTGDYNIAHTEIDIHDPKGNKNSSGFLPEERAWMTHFLQSGWIDTFRHIYPTATGAYSWWSQRFPTVRLQNKGWRIDYICTTNAMQKNIVNAGILPDAKHSDHCPIWVDLKV
jgi:exodeoxyribonuclease III